jgi:23S rRNA (pseudouridine1915-N3)-methyltransferase
MRITLLTVGKTTDHYLLEGIDKYVQRLKHYVPFKMLELPELKHTKSLSQEQQKAREATLILKQLNPTDYLILLDEQGKEMTSTYFSTFLNKKMVGAVQHLIFVIGGPYGFDSCVYSRANERISLSKMTFSHQMVRLFFMEQLYRAYTILKGEPYHHS